MKRIFLVRHGEIPSNRIKRYAGWNDEGLTEKGIKQAKEVSIRLKNYNIKKLFTSPIKRAIQTADIIGQTFGLESLIETGLKEFRLGPWEGMYEEDIALKYPKEWDIWNRNPAYLNLPNRETLDELLNRALGAIERIKDKMYDEESAAAVTHVAIIRVLSLYSQKKDLNLYKTIHVSNGAILDFYSGTFI